MLSMANKRRGFIYLSIYISVGVLLLFAFYSGNWAYAYFVGFLPLIIFLMIRPNIMFIILPIVAYFWYPLVVIGQGESVNNITAADVLLALLLFVTLMRLALYKRDIDTKALGQAFKLLLVVLATGITGGLAAYAGTGSTNSALLSVLLFLKEWGLYALLPVAAAVVLKKSDKDKVITAIIISTVIASAISFFSQDYIERAISFIYNPNVFGMIAVIGINTALTCLLFRSNQNRKNRANIFYVAAILLNLFGLIGSASRSATLALGVSMIFIIVSASSVRTWKRIVPIVLTAALIVFLIMQVQYSSVFRERWSNVFETGLENPSILLRKDAATAGIQMSLDRPILGYGYGQVRESSYSYATEFGKHISYISTTDNQYIDMMLKAGLVGLIFFILSLYLIWRRTRKEDWDGIGTNSKNLVVANLLAFLVAGIGMPSFAAPITSLLFWSIVALLYIGDPNIRSERIEVAGVRWTAFPDP